MSELWAVYVPGPNEYLAMPSEQVAREMAVRHNAAMAGSAEFARIADVLGLSVAELDVVACPWPFDAAWHAEDVAVMQGNDKGALK